MINFAIDYVKKKLKGEFARSLVILVGGTASAQVLTMAAMPVLSRLYSPSDFGILAVFLGIVTTISVSACLRFDIAVAIPEQDQEAFSLLVLALISAVFFSALTALLLTYPPMAISQWLSSRNFGDAVWLIPFGVFFCSAFSAMQNWQIRQKNFVLIAKSRFAQAVFGIGVQVLAGIFAAGPLGLLVGSVVGFAANSYSLSHRAMALFSFKKNYTLLRMIRRYCNYPLFSTWEAFANQAAIHLPILIIASALAPSEAGYLMLAMSVTQAPMSIFGAAIGQIYLSNAGSSYRSGQLYDFTLQIVKKLFRAGFLPIIFAALLAPLLFPLLFGEDWQRAGLLVTWMAPWFLLQFLTSPVSMSLHIIGAQKTAMALQIFVMLLRIGMTFSAVQWLPDFTAEIYAISGFFAYGIYLAVVLHKVRCVLSRMAPFLNGK